MYRRYQKKFNWIALKLVLFMIIIFFLQLFFPAITESFLLVSSDIFSRPWILITSIFLHGGWVHLLYNMFALFLFGSFLEKQIGGTRFLLVFFSTGLIASVIASLFYDASLGASGAVYGVIGMLTILRPLMPVWAFGVPMPLIIASILWIIGDIAGFASYMQGVPGGIANAAHLGGAFIGILIGFMFRGILRYEKRRLRMLRRRRRFF